MVLSSILQVNFREFLFHDKREFGRYAVDAGRPCPKYSKVRICGYCCEESACCSSITSFRVSSISSTKKSLRRCVPRVLSRSLSWDCGFYPSEPPLNGLNFYSIVFDHFCCLFHYA